MTGWQVVYWLELIGLLSLGVVVVGTLLSAVFRLCAKAYFDEYAKYVVNTTAVRTASRQILERASSTEFHEVK